MSVRTYKSNLAALEWEEESANDYSQAFVDSATACCPEDEPVIAQRALSEVQAGDALAAKGDYQQARQYYANAVRLQPQQGLFHWLLAMADWNLGDREGAGGRLQQAIECNPELGRAHASLSYWYLSQGMVEQALISSEKAVAFSKDDLNTALTRAWVLEAAGQTDAAWELLQQVVAGGFLSPMVAMLYGRLAQQRKQQDAALNLIAHVLNACPIAPQDASALHLTAAGLFDSLGHYDDAFAHAAYGNALVRRPFEIPAHAAIFQRMMQFFTRENLRCLPRASYRSDKPVFIVGMPRSGTSLVEQILASHPDVYGAGELDFMYRVVAGTLDMLQATEVEYPDCLENLSVSQCNGMAQIYLEPLAALKPGAKRITDKMPLNFMHLGMVQLLLPNARIIHCTRDPMDTCLSCFMTQFASGNDFKYDLTHLGLFYRLYEQLMAHWKQSLDLPILEVRYEDVIADQEGQARRMVEFLGLPWDDRCTRFYETQRSVATASVEQVRKPIYQSSMQRWRRYEKHLGPLIAALNSP